MIRAWDLLAIMLGSIKSLKIKNIGGNLSQKIKSTNINIKTFLKGDYRTSIVFNLTTPDQIEKITSSLKNKNSCGFDNINIKVVKATIFKISNTLSKLINISLMSGLVPDGIKIAKVIPLFKAGDRQLQTNYRPISILPCFSKIYEKVVYKRMMSYILNFNILNKNQYGFRNKHSTIMAVCDFVERLSNAVDQGFHTVGIFLDLSKAFDTINHHILLKKIGILWYKRYPTKMV